MTRLVQAATGVFVLAASAVSVGAAPGSSGGGAPSGATGLTATYLGELRGGSGEAALRGPLAVALDAAGNVAVVEQESYRVSVFASDGRLLRHVGGPRTCQWGCAPGANNGRFFLPNGIAVDASGFLYVSDLGSASNGSSGRVQKFAPDGSFVAAIEGVGLDHFSYPRDVAVDASGGVYVADWGKQRVLLLAGNTGGFVNEWAASEFYPEGLAVDDVRGRLYVGADDAAGNRIAVLSAGGGFATSFGQGLRRVEKLAVDREGRVYATESSRVSVFSDRGELLGQWGSSGTGPGEFRQSTGIAVNDQGLVYVGDYGNGRVQVFRVEFGR